MRKLVFILLVSIAVVTFIRAFEDSGEIYSDAVRAEFIQTDFSAREIVTEDGNGPITVK